MLRPIKASSPPFPTWAVNNSHSGRSWESRISCPHGLTHYLAPHKVGHRVLPRLAPCGLGLLFLNPLSTHLAQFLLRDRVTDREGHANKRELRKSAHLKPFGRGDHGLAPLNAVHERRGRGSHLHHLHVELLKLGLELLEVLRPQHFLVDHNVTRQEKPVGRLGAAYVVERVLQPKNWLESKLVFSGLELVFHDYVPWLAVIGST